MYQTDSPFSVPLSKEEKWEQEFRDYGIKVMSDVALCYEVDEFFPRYVFIDRYFHQRGDKTELSLFGDFTRGGITFFDKEEKPFYPDKNNIDGFRWFAIELRNFSLVKTYILEHQPMQVIKNGIEGWIISLSESERFEGWSDLNAYLHALMFWEGMLKSSEAGPIMERISWLSQNLYYQRHCVVQLAETIHNTGLSKSVTPMTSIEELNDKITDGVQRLKDKHEAELAKEKTTADTEKTFDKEQLLETIQDIQKLQDDYYRELTARNEMMSSVLKSMYDRYINEISSIEKNQDQGRLYFEILSKKLRELTEDDTEK